MRMIRIFGARSPEYLWVKISSLPGTIVAHVPSRPTVISDSSPVFVVDFSAMRTVQRYCQLMIRFIGSAIRGRQIPGDEPATVPVSLPQKE